MAADNLPFQLCQLFAAESLGVFKGKAGVAVAVETVPAFLFSPVIVKKVVENCASGSGLVVPVKLFADEIAEIGNACNVLKPVYVKVLFVNGKALNFVGKINIFNAAEKAFFRLPVYFVRPYIGSAEF